MKIITLDPFLCVGCGNCELACAYMQTRASAAPTCEPEAAQIRVEHYRSQRAVVPLTCLHCQQAWCLAACPTGALQRDPHTQAVVVAKELCAGCRCCVLACPFGQMHFDEEQGMAHKCELCGGQPRCVDHCVTNALQYEEPEVFAARLRRRAGQRRAEQIAQERRRNS